MERYLGSNASVVVGQMRARSPDWFRHADTVATYASKVLHQLQVHRGNVRELLASLLFQRVAAGFEVVLLLAERGMHTQGLVQRRSVLEALFVLGAIWQKPEWVERFLASDDQRVLEIYKKIKRLPPEVLATLEPEMSLPFVEAKITEFKAKTGGRKGPQTAEYAKAADLEAYYLTDYSVTSESAHNVAKDLERHIHLDVEGDVVGMWWGPEGAPAQELLLLATQYVLMACFAVESLFGTGPSSELAELQRAANEIIEQSGSAG
jgi:hypothetical protein